MTSTLRLTRRPKYGNRKTEVDGILFDSAKEAKRYQELAMLEKAGHIRELERQPKFPLYCPMRSFGAHELVGVYRADFRYREGREGLLVVEDVKSPATKANALYRWKKKHVEAQYGVTIREV